MKDYFTAIDEMAQEPFVDKDRLGCVGAIITADGFVPLYTEARKTTTVGRCV